MMTKIFAKGALAVAVVGGLLASTYGCDQPKPKCAAGRGAFIGVYKKVSGPDSCADLKGEKLGFSTYNAQSGKLGKPNLDVGTIAIQAESLGTLIDTAEAGGSVDKDPTHKPYALGNFTTAEPVNDFCEVPTLSVATQTIPEVKADPDNEIEASPETTVSYAWSNVRVYVTAAALGTQFTANLTLTTDKVQCGYQVVGMYPYVECTKKNPANKKVSLPDERDCSPDSDEDPSVGCTKNEECFSNVCDQGLCRCVTSAGCCADKDVAKCDTSGNRCAPPPAGSAGTGSTCHDAPRPTGSGINPDFPTKCDPDLLVCVVTKDVPALK